MPRVPTDHVYTDTEPEPDWLIPNTLHKGNLVVLAGVAGIGKSVFSYALANSVATGVPLLGATPPRRVLYCDEENGRGDLAAYARWTWRGLGCPDKALLDANLRIESRTLSGSNAWNITLRQLAADFKPDLILLDTTTPACHIRDENDNAEASAACQQIRLAMDAASADCATIALKHLRVDHDTGRVDVRGAKHWKGAVDAIWYHLFCRGPKRLDGWRNTLIRPEKSRAYGLRDDIRIVPSFKTGLFINLAIERRNNIKTEESTESMD